MLRIEWCKSRARARRWSEEVALLLEEMRRVTAFLEWQAAWWETQDRALVESDCVQREGLSAYCQRQASIRQEMRARFAGHWNDVETYASMGLDDDELLRDSQITPTQ